MSQPNKIPQAWAVGGDYNDIPKEDAGTGLASWEEGFPPETQTPLAAGGVAPRRQDMNGALNWMSSSLLWYQQGGLWQYDALEDYERGNVVLQNNSLYYCISNNGPSGTVKSPAADSNEAYWKPIIFANGKHPDPDHLAQPAVLQVLQAVYPIGSIYASYNNTSPSTLFGFGTWAKIEGRFLLGTSSTYGLGSTGGSSTVTLTINQIPAHNHGGNTGNAGTHNHTITVASGGTHSHTASSANNGAHSHTITVNSGGTHKHTASSASAGAHTHTASSNSTGAHTHTRGTMEITGSIRAVDNDGADYYATGAFTAKNVGSGDDGNHGNERKQFDFTASRTWTGSTSSAGAHSHTITVNSVGAHSHTITVNDGGSHAHTASSNSTGAHNHTITVNNGGSHNHSASSANNGNHSHSIASNGSGQSHENMPPYLAVNLWRRTA